MKFGMPTLVECKDIEECAALAYECGLDFIEINMSFPQYLPSSLDINRLKEIKKEKNLFYATSPCIKETKPSPRYHSYWLHLLQPA